MSLEQQFTLAMESYTQATNVQEVEMFERAERQLRYAIAMYDEAIKPLQEAQRELIAHLASAERERLELEKVRKASAIKVYAVKKGSSKKKPSLKEQLVSLTKEDREKLLAELLDGNLLII